MKLIFAIIVISSSNCFIFYFYILKELLKLRTFSKNKSKSQRIEMIILIYLLYILDINYWLLRLFT